jgi:hypothetical protein
VSGKVVDWRAWHTAYDAADSSLSRRLVVVRGCVREALARTAITADGPLRVVSLCAGDGRDLLPVLAGHVERDRVQARLVELDPELAAAAQRSVAALGLSAVEVRCADAGRAEELTALAPLHVVLACGVFGNVTHEDAVATLAAIRGVLAPGGIVIWTRGRSAEDDEPASPLRDWLAAHGFTELAFVAPEDAVFRVGMHRFGGGPLPTAPTGRMFTFVR